MSESRGEIPEKIDRYEIIEAIGFGATGAVYKAFDPIIKRPVAVKTLRLDVPPQSPDYKAFLDRFATEARTAGRLSHPNIITLYDVGHTDDQVPWLAMEFVEGQTVAELLEGERLEAEVVVGLVSQIAAAVDYAHSEGVIHRDIKPSNVIVYGGEKVKVTDFGIAKLMDADVTHSGLMMGTPSYMSPEQAMGEDLDGRTDIFSLGVVAFEMLSGEQPFPGNNVTSILYKLVHADPIHPDNLEVLGLLPDKWHEVFSRVLAKDPVDRFPTAAAFVEELEHCLGSWFGSLEGETVIITDPTNIPGSAPPAAKPIAPARPKSALPREPADRLDDFSDLDETVMVTWPSDALLEAETATLERDVSLAGEAPTLTHAPTGEETVYVPPPESNAEETLYAADSDKTVIPGEASDETLHDPKSVSTAAVRRPRLRRKDLVVLGGAATAVIALVLALLLVGGGEEPEPVAIAMPEPPVVVDSGSVIVTTEPAGATVLVDGETRGQTPLALVQLPLAVYELRIEHDGFDPEDRSAELTAEAPRATFDVTLRPSPPKPPPPAYVRIRSEPPGAQVEIDGDAVGTTPTDRLHARTGNRTVRIVREGYLPWEDTVQVRSGRTVDVDAELTARPRVEATVDETPPVQVAPRVEPGTLVERGDPGVVNPKCVRCPAVRYPEAARKNGLEGAVELTFIIDENGAVQNVEIRQSGGEVFDSAVTSVVRDWRYEPATQHGVPVKIRWVQVFRFRQGR